MNMPSEIYSYLPHLNAGLNATTLVLICAGLMAIRHKLEFEEEGAA